MKNVLKLSTVPALLTALIACSGNDTQETEPKAEQSSPAEQVQSQAISPQIETALLAQNRTEKNKARDQYRHPVETLAFFQVQPDDIVIEIWPGGGWYTEILAPLLRKDGQLVLAHFPKDSGVPFYTKMRNKFEHKLGQSAAYENVSLSDFRPPSQVDISPADSADKVLTFRNVHNWMKSESEKEAFKAFYDALRPGGVLGVVEHRANPEATLEQQIKSGYVTEAYVKQLAQEAGFEFVASSEVNANLKDTKDYEAGVWALPPSLRVPEDQKAAQLEIGESDRMTLLFKKPE